MSSLIKLGVLALYATTACGKLLTQNDNKAYSSSTDIIPPSETINDPESDLNYIFNSLQENHLDDKAKNPPPPPLPQPQPDEIVQPKKPKPLPSKGNGGSKNDEGVGSDKVDNGNIPVAEIKLFANDGVPYMKFGHSVACTKNILAVGTSVASPDSTRVYLYSYKSNLSISTDETEVEEVNPEEITPNEVTPEEVTPEEVTPEEDTPEEVTPEEVTPEEVTPEEVTPEEVTPEEVTPEEVTPEEVNTEEVNTDEVSETDPIQEENSINAQQQLKSKKKMLKNKRKLMDTEENNAWQQFQVLSSSQTTYDGFGLGIAISEDFLAIGAPYDDSKGYLSGKVYLYDINKDLESPNLYAENLNTPYITSTSPFTVGALFGSSLAVNGNCLAVGAPGDSTENTLQGSVFVYTYSEEEKKWKQQEILYDQFSGGTYHHYGASLSLSENTLVVGATGYNNAASIESQTYSSKSHGAVYIYTKVHEMSNTEVEVLNENKQDIEQLNEDGVDSLVSSYSISSLSIETSPFSWKLESIFSPADLSNSAHFGYAISFTDTNGLVSAYDDNHGSIVYLYEKDTNGWYLKNIFYPTDSNSYNNPMFGHSLALHTILSKVYHENSHEYEEIEQKVAVIGSPGDSSMGVQSGAVYIFSINNNEAHTLNDKRLLRQQSLEAEQNLISTSKVSTTNKSVKMIAKFTCADSNTYNSYGQSIALHNNILFVGAELADTPVATMAGAVYMEDNTINFFLSNPTDNMGDSTKQNDKSSFWSFLNTRGIITVAAFPAAFLLIFIIIKADKVPEINKNIFTMFNSDKDHKYSSTLQDNNGKDDENEEDKTQTYPKITEENLQLNNKKNSTLTISTNNNPVKKNVEWTVNPMKLNPRKDLRVNGKQESEDESGNSSEINLDQDTYSNGSLSIRSPITHINPYTTMLVPSPMIQSKQSSKPSYRPLPLQNTSQNTSNDIEPISSTPVPSITSLSSTITNLAKSSWMKFTGQANGYEPANDLYEKELQVTNSSISRNSNISAASPSQDKYNKISKNNQENISKNMNINEEVQYKV